MVLGHEFGHHQKKHIMKRLTSSILLQVMFTMVTGYNIDGLGGLFANMFFTAYGREQEHEADEFGVKFVHGVYKETKGLLEFYRNAEELQGTSQFSKMSSWVETHPHMSERIERIEDLIETLEP